MLRTIALFGEAEKGKINKPHIVKSLPELIDIVGHPSTESEGLFFAIQALLFQRQVIFFPVHEEGFSKPDYFMGLRILKSYYLQTPVHGICMPKVGDKDILDAFNPVCMIYKTPLIISEKDLFDFLSS